MISRFSSRRKNEKRFWGFCLGGEKSLRMREKIFGGFSLKEVVMIGNLVIIE